MLRVSDLRKSFPSPNGETIAVLRGVTFSATGGETLAVMGASGAGKSTLLHVVGGLETPDSGSVQLEDFAINAEPPARVAHLRNQHIGFIFQFHHLLPDLSAAENVALPLMIAGAGQSESMNKARNSLAHLGLGPRVDHPASYLSGGEQQRVAVSRALITAPKLVLADEPTGNLDQAFENEISSQLVDYARIHRKFLVVATHNERLASMCDRVLRLEDGVLKAG